MYSAWALGFSILLLVASAVGEVLSIPGAPITLTTFAADVFREPSLAELETESFSRRLRSLMFDTNSVGGDDSNCHHFRKCSFHHCASSGCCVFYRGWLLGLRSSTVGLP